MPFAVATGSVVAVAPGLAFAAGEGPSAAASDVPAAEQTGHPLAAAVAAAVAVPVRAAFVPSAAVLIACLAAYCSCRFAERQLAVGASVAADDGAYGAFAAAATIVDCFALPYTC